MDIKIYGSRGTLPLSSRENVRFGGNTTCIKVTTSGRTIVIDCGSGLAGYLRDLAPFLASGQSLRLDLLISHLHLDHIIGLPVFSPLYREGHDIRIYTASRDVRPLSEQIFGAFRPPYWPISLEQRCHAQCIAIDRDKPFYLGEGVRVTPFASRHQDQTTGFRIDGDRSLVYLLDYELGCEPDYGQDHVPVLATGLTSSAQGEDLVALCRDADLVIVDSAYLPEDYPDRRGWGHSSYKAWIPITEAAGCRQVVFCHLSYEYTDRTLSGIVDRMTDGMKTAGKYILAYDGLELSI